MKEKHSIYALLLVGGKSTRMGEDKAKLIYRDQTPEWQRLHKLLTQCCEKVYLCHRADQAFSQPAIIDEGKGVLAAIAEAQTQHPKITWLVLACDLPLLDSQTLDYLLKQRDAEAVGTAYKSTIDAKPEPLCALYEPKSNALIQQQLEQANQENKEEKNNKHACPRAVLKNATLIEQPNPNALRNANSKADQLEIAAILDQKREEKTLHIEYFAQHQEWAGRTEEKITTFSVTASGLYEEIKAKYGFSHKQKHLMLAINDAFAPWETKLQDRDKIVFIPPVAGG